MSVKRVLVLRNAVTGDASFSNKGVDKAITALKAAHPDAEFIERDLVTNAVPMLTHETCEAIGSFKLDTPVQKEADRLANELIEELKSVDFIIIGVPRYNFGVPTSFKAYLDYVTRPTKTFAYGANGPEGFLPNVPVWLIMSAGGIFGEDYYTQWLRTLLPFIGLKWLTFFPIEGVALGKGEEALAKFDEQVEQEIKTISA